MDWCQHASCVQVPLPLPQSKNTWFLASWDAALWCWTHKFGPFLRPLQKSQDCSLMPTQSLPVLRHRYIPNFGLGLCFGGRTGRVQCLCWTELKACDFSWLFDTCSNLIQKCVAKRKMKRAQICAKKPQIGAKTRNKPQIYFLPPLVVILTLSSACDRSSLKIFKNFDLWLQNLGSRMSRAVSCSTLVKGCAMSCPEKSGPPSSSTRAQIEALCQLPTFLFFMKKI